MIFYFSATGNNRYVAEEIAGYFSDRAYSVSDRIQNSDYSIILSEKERLGFVFPTYFYGFPSVVSEFLQKITGNSEGHYVYLIASYGTSPGATASFARKYMKHSGIRINAFYSIRMPDTWTPEFDLSDREAVRKINEAEPAQIRQITAEIEKGAAGNFMEHRHSYPVSVIANTIYNRSVRKTSHFHVEDSCIGCGLCAEKCPVQAIEMRDSRPVWVKDRCVMCVGCLHRCPKFAIQYEDKTKNHGQYTHPGVKI